MIRKIVIGRDPKDAMAYYVGMRAGAGKVVAITEDESHLHKFSKKRYLIYIENEEGTMYGRLLTICLVLLSMT